MENNTNKVEVNEALNSNLNKNNSNINAGNNQTLNNKPLNSSVNTTNNFNNVNQNVQNKVSVSEGKKTRYKYTILNEQGIKVKGFIDAYSKDDVVRFLQNDKVKILKIESQSGFLNMQIGSTKFKISDLSFLLTQLSTYLKAGIPLIDSVKILEKQSVKAEQKRVFSNIAYELMRGENFSTALSKQGKTFPDLLVNMVRTAELTGDLPEILDDMAEYYTSIDRTRKAAISALTYPSIIMIFALIVVTFIVVYIVPQFETMFNENNATLPGITVFVINTSQFIRDNYLFIIGGIVLFVLLFIICFKKIKGFRKFIQTIIMKLPIVGNIKIYKEVTMFTKTFASLLAHNVFITDSMAILSTISSNEVYKEIINDSLEYLSKGAKISESFKGKWAFPVVAYEMLVTGENTGRLALMMDYVARYYEDLHANSVKRINTFIEPVLIIFLAIVVGTVVLSVIIPMFSFYNQIK